MNDLNLNAPCEAVKLACLLTGESTADTFNKCGGDPDTLKSRRIWPRYRGLNTISLPSADGGLTRLRPQADRSYQLTCGRRGKLELSSEAPSAPVELASADLKAARAAFPALARATHHALWVAYAAYLLPYSGAKRAVVAYGEAYAKSRLTPDERDDTVMITLHSMVSTVPATIEAAMGAPSLFLAFMAAHDLTLEAADDAVDDADDAAEVESTDEA